MTKEQKIELVKELVERFQTYPNFYIANTGGMTVAEVSELRAACFKSNVKMQVIKNSLIKKALEQLDVDLSGVYPALKTTSAVFFIDEENASVPAKVLKEYRGKKKEIPALKGAVIDTAVFLGDNQLDILATMKSKGELLGEILGLLQSPAKNVLGALQSGGQTLAGLVKTLQERGDAA
jgi:large subunit ribosomal protein L10